MASSGQFLRERSDLFGTITLKFQIAGRQHEIFGAETERELLGGAQSSEKAACATQCDRRRGYLEHDQEISQSLLLACVARICASVQSRCEIKPSCPQGWNK